MDDNSFPVRHRFSLSDDDGRQSTMCKCPQDDDYQTSSKCSSNRHCSHDLSHASSMWGERNRRTPTRSSTFPVSRVTNRAKPARDAALSPWMCPPAVAQRLEHSLQTLHHMYETCCSHQLTRSKYSWPFPPSTEDPSAGSPSDLPSATCRRTLVLLTAHVDTKVSRSRSTNQGFIRNLRSNPPCPSGH